MYLSVAPLINLPRDKNQFFFYQVPFFLEKKILIGQLVSISFKKRMLKGIVVEIKKEKPEKKMVLKEIIQIENEKQVLSKEQLELAYWMKDFYLSSLGLILKTFLPESIIQITHNK